jgi:hypothetical protein
MDNINDMKIKLKELEALLVSHDWYYMMSDDNRYYKQGRKSFELITKIMLELKDGGYYTEANNLYDKYSK